MNRVKIVCLIIFLLPLVTMIGCGEPDYGCLLIPCDKHRNPVSWLKDECNVDEYVCAGECTPVDIDCCIDSFGDEVGSCPKENPFCCEEYDL